MSPARDVAKQVVRAAANAVGFEVTSFHRFGMDAHRDIATLLAGISRPIVFDVGANFGQSVTRFRQLLPGSEIYSFEPAPKAFRDLQTNTQGMTDVHIVNAGVGSSTGTAMLAENDEAVMTSFLQPDSDSWSTVVRETPVQVVTLDEFCDNRGVDHIDLLKTDTQGFDLEVLKGAARLMRDSRIRLVFMEVIFSDLYVGQARFDEEFRFLVDHGFRFMSFYDFERLDGKIPSWCDALFANPAVLTG